ncbi:MAG: uroporphyrinogen-III synthase [Myxococcaceae bacterium]
MAHVLLLTSPAEAEALAFLLEDEGHEPLFLPVSAAPASPGLRAAAEHLHRFNWVIVIDRPALSSLLEAVHQAGSRSSVPRVQWLVVDAGAARSVERLGGVARIPAELKWTAAVSGLITADDEVLVVGALEGPSAEPAEVMLESLDALGAKVTRVVQAPPAAPDVSALPAVPVVVVHSPAAADAFATLTLGVRHAPSESCCGTPHHQHAPAWSRGASARVVATSAATAEALQSAGVPVYAVAPSPAADVVADAALAALKEESSPP